MGVIPEALLKRRLLALLEEDVGEGDITTEIAIPPGTVAEAVVVAKEGGVVAGLLEARVLFEALSLEVQALTEDGSPVEASAEILGVRGDARALLTGERLALNILMRMSGIATETRKIITQLMEAGFKTKIASTRKTAPGLRAFDKRAVVLGGGDPHRLHLDDLILVKTNHIAAGGGLEKVLKRVREGGSFTKKVEVEVSSLKEALRAVEFGVDLLMLDNMKPSEAGGVIGELERRGLRGRVLVEVSGGVDEKSILKYAALKPDVISLGHLTENVRPLDMSLKIQPKIGIFKTKPGERGRKD